MNDRELSRLLLTTLEHKSISTSLTHVNKEETKYVVLRTLKPRASRHLAECKVIPTDDPGHDYS